MSEFSGPKNPYIAWSYEICENNYEWVVGDIVVDANGTIYIPVSLSVEEGYLYAINPDGTFKWQFQFEGICSPEKTVPAIAPDGTIYIHVNGDANLAAPERIYAIKPDGTKKWEYHESVLAFWASDITSPVIADDNSIIYTSMNTAGTRISSSGEHLADFIDPPYNSIKSSPALSSGDTLYIHEDMAIKAYNLSGELLWSSELPGDNSSGYNGSPSVDKDGTIYYANQDSIFAISTDGEIKWSRSLGIYAAFGLYSTPAISYDGPIVSTNYALYAFTKEGNLRWTVNSSYTSPASKRLSSPIIGTDGLIYWQTVEGLGANATLLIIDNGGNIIESLKFPFTGYSNRIAGSPRQSGVIIQDSTLLCINGNSLLAIKNIKPNIPVGIVNFNSVGQIKIFPNSTKDILNIEGVEKDYTQVIIYTMEGKILKQMKNKGINQIDLSDLHQGIYFLRIIHSKMIYTEKIIKR